MQSSKTIFFKIHLFHMFHDNNGDENLNALKRSLCKRKQLALREKTNNLGSDQVQYKPGCTVKEDGWRLEIFGMRK